MSAAEEYAKICEQTVEPFFRQAVTPFTIAALKNAVTLAQKEFLYQNPNYVAALEIVVTNNGGGNFHVAAPICTYLEKIEIDRAEADRTALLAEHLAKTKAEDAEKQKRKAKMIRKHRKLMARYAAKIPPGTKSVWENLDVEEQYAILKDLDYNARHALEASVP